MDLCHRCTACTEHQNKPPKVANHPWMLPEKPWSRVHVDHALNSLGSNWLVLSIHTQSIHASILPPPHPPSPPQSSWSKTSHTLAIHILLCWTMPLHSPQRSSRRRVVRGASGAAERLVQTFKQGIHYSITCTLSTGLTKSTNWSCFENNLLQLVVDTTRFR